VPIELDPTVNVAAPVAPEERITLVGLIEAVNPVVAEAFRDIVPEKPFRLARLMVEVPVDPATMPMFAGLAVMVKSATFTVIKVEWVNVPFVADTVTV